MKNITKRKTLVLFSLLFILPSFLLLPNLRFNFHYTIVVESNPTFEKMFKPLQELWELEDEIHLLSQRINSGHLGHSRPLAPLWHPPAYRLLKDIELAITKDLLAFPEIPESIKKSLRRSIHYTLLVKICPPFTKKKKLCGITSKILKLLVCHSSYIQDNLKESCVAPSSYEAVLPILKKPVKFLTQRCRGSPPIVKTNQIFPSVWPRAPNFF